MIINHNIAALNTYRQLSINNTSTQKALEKLSSGLRINRAGDDAAGLAISEKMRGQIRGLEQASRNAQDGISLIQTAEGALNETHSILQRMRELAVQSANDTNTEVDREELQKEVDQLAEELTRIAENTEFNTKTLLDGSFKGKFHIGANESQNIELSINNVSADALNVAGTEAAAFEQTVAIADVGSGNFSDGTYQVIEVADYKGSALAPSNVEGGDVAAVTHVMVDADGNAVATSIDDGVKWTYNDATAQADTITFSEAVVGGEVTISGSGTKATATVGVTDAKLESGTYTIVDISSHPTLSSYKVGLQNSAGEIVALGTNSSGNIVSDITAVEQFASVNDTNEALMEVKSSYDLKVGDVIKVQGKGIDISSQESADAAVTIIQKAIETVSAERSKLGAYQNRLEHTINNLGTSAENLTAAESRIRDVDMAEEMMEFTKMNILSQAAQAMLAQANQLPQGVLQLLR